MNLSLKNKFIVITIGWALSSVSALHAVPLDIENVPLGSEVHVPPNIMMIADDSASMMDQTSSDYLVYPVKGCWNDGGTAMTNCTTLPPIGTDYGAGYGTPPPMLSAAFNRLVYNPLVTYNPPKKADGTYMQSMTRIYTNNWKNVVWEGKPKWTGVPGAVDLSRSPYYSSYGGLTLLKKKYMRGIADDDPVWDPFKNGKAPLHYYKTSMKWCKSTRSSGDLKGSADPGVNFSNCQNDYDTDHVYPYYYSQFGEYTGKTDNEKYPAFEVVTLDPVQDKDKTYTHQFYNEEKGAMDSFTRTFDEEMTNFANWAAYYRTRAAAIKTTASQAFASIKEDSKTLPSVGYAAVYNSSDYLVPGAFKSDHRNSFYSKLFNFDADGRSTPLRERLNSVASKYKNYITLSCQRNYIVMFTDGTWNENFSVIGNKDSSLPTGGLPEPLPPGSSVYGTTELKGGDQWPLPIRDTKNASSTLADVAMHYWMTDLDGNKTNNNVIHTNKDPATWQHINFMGMGFGVVGELPSSDQDATLAKITSGDLAWPVPQGNQPTTVDDLWHATVNGFGSYVNASSPEEFGIGLTSILNEIMNAGGARSGVGLATQDLTKEDNLAFSASFSPGWNGELESFKIDKEGNIGGSEWLASKKLNEQLTVTEEYPKPWETNRNVFTRIAMESGTDNAVPFLYNKLNSAQLAVLGSTKTQQENVISYLRGDRSREGQAIGKMRKRGGILGDIVNAQPVVISAPSWEYDETYNEGYDAFKKSKADRELMVYVGANDGMLHAFNKNGRESWAYIPSDLFRPLDRAGIANLTHQESNADWPFRHYYYVDATPSTMDVKVNGKWRSYLVGGLGKGGTSYYALDVTDPIENNPGSISQWEFTHEDMGYTYGRAVITKTNLGDQWYALMPSGYNNGDVLGKGGDGKGHVFVVDLETGKEKATLSTSEGSADSPSGLAYVAGYVEKHTNQLTTAAYAGDQLGNLWRFNMETNQVKDWGVTRMAILKDPKGKSQWVSVEP
jgi:Tfp pilus assembly protein, tip-associated adhesin PilY1